MSPQPTDEEQFVFQSNPHAERLIGTIRRECLDQSVILGERQLRAVLQEYFE